MGIDYKFSLNRREHQPQYKGVPVIDQQTLNVIQVELMRKHFNVTYGQYFDPYTKNLMLDLTLHKTQDLARGWKMQNRVFAAVVAMMLMWLIIYWLLACLHWSFPILSATFIVICCKYPPVHILVLAIWLLGKVVCRICRPKVGTTSSDMVNPGYYARPIEVKERFQFREIQSTVELFIMLSAGIWLIYTGNQSLYPLLGVVVFIAFVRAVPTAGGHSTMGVISLGLLMLFTMSLLGPVIIVQWKGALGITDVKPSGSNLPVTTTDVPTQIWQIWESMTTRIFSGLGMGLNLLALTGFMRSAMGFVFLAYSTLDAICGPGKVLSGMVHMIRTRDTTMPNIRVADLASAHLFIYLVQVVWTCGMGGTLQVLSCIIGSVLAGVIWYACGAQPWLCQGIFACMTAARTDVQITRFDNPSGYRVAMARLSGLVLIVLYIVEGGFTGLATILLLAFVVVMRGEKMMCLYVGVLSCNLCMIALAFCQKEPLTGDIKTNAVTAADPTYIASGRNSGNPSDTVDPAPPTLSQGTPRMNVRVPERPRTDPSLSQPS